MDSQASLGAVTKGRSSKFPMLRQCRVLCALALGLQLHIKVRWIESAAVMPCWTGTVVDYVEESYGHLPIGRG